MLTCVLLVFRIRKVAFIPYVIMHSYTVKHICVWLQIRRAALLPFDTYVHLYNWCWKAPVYHPQQVDILTGYLYWCPVAPMCCGALQAAMYILADSIYISGLVFNVHSITGAEKRRFTIHNKWSLWCVICTGALWRLCAVLPCIALMTLREEATNIFHLLQKSLPSHRGAGYTM